MVGSPAVLAYGERDELTENEIVAADIPARFEPDLVMDVTNRSYALDIFKIEPAVEQPRPMRSLRRLEARNIAADQPRQVRLSGDMLIEPVEQFRQRRLDDLPELPKQLAGPGVDPHESHPRLAIMIAVGATGIYRQRVAHLGVLHCIRKG